MATQVLMSDRIQIHVEVRGSGPAILLSHGLSGSARNWRGTLAALTEYTAITYDVRGHSRSGVHSSAEHFTRQRLVQDMLEILSAYEQSNVTCIGLSMGAMLSLFFALTNPDRVGALILASLPNIDPSFQGVASYAEKFADAIREEGLEKAGERFVWGAESGLSKRDAAMVRLGFLEHEGLGIANILSSFLAKMGSPESLRVSLAQLKMPILIISGERDLGARAAAEKFNSMLPHSELGVISNAGHLVNIEQKQAFNDQIIGFLAKHAI